MAMLRLSLIGILSLAVCHGSFAQEPEDACPKIRLDGPSGVTRAIESYTVRIDPYPEQPGRQFNWTVTGGKLLKGIGEKTIEVQTPESGSLMVKIEVQGLPAGCPNTVTESTWIDPVAPAVLIDHLDR